MSTCDPQIATRQLFIVDGIAIYGVLYGRFIVELCDTVLVHSIEIATFELFSSVPEAFVVYTSSR